MRTTLSLKIPKRSVTPLIAVLLLTGTVSLGTACDDDKGPNNICNRPSIT